MPMPLPMQIAKLEKLIWLLIYGGLLVLCVGLFVARTGAALGLVMVVGGAIVALAGAVLIVVRARIEDPKGR